MCGGVEAEPDQRHQGAEDAVEERRRPGGADANGKRYPMRTAVPETVTISIEPSLPITS